jgi:phosphate transport system substrate-binding protein
MRRILPGAAARAAAVAGLLLGGLVAAPAAAQDITLISRDGTLSIEGTLLGFDGEFYRVGTGFGPVTVDARGVVCEGPGCPTLGAFVAEAVLAGDAAMAARLVPALAEAFAAERGMTLARSPAAEGRETLEIRAPDGRAVARLTVIAVDSGAGLAALIAGDADLALAAREATAAENAAAEAAGIGRLDRPGRERMVALDAVVAAAAPGGPLAAIAPEALAELVAGRLADWGGLGGPAGEPVAVHLLAADGAGGATLAALLPGAPAPGAQVRRHADPDALATALLRDPLAIGLTLASGLGPARALPLAGPCAVALAPTSAAIRTGDYPLVRPVFLYRGGGRLPAVIRDFLDFAVSPAAARAVRRAGFTDLQGEAQPLAAQGERLARAIAAAGGETGLAALQEIAAALQGTARLAATFRFREGAAGLDATSRAQALRLAEALEAGLHDGRELVFAGFSDGMGPAAANRRIALGRAETARGAVRARAETADPARVRLVAAGFGEALPIACEETAWGRAVNRRVEVWVRDLAGVLAPEAPGAGRPANER